MNERFGAGFVSLVDLLENIPADVWVAWTTFILEDELNADRAKKQAEHDDVMKAAAKAAG